MKIKQCYIKKSELGEELDNYEIGIQPMFIRRFKRIKRNLVRDRDVCTIGVLPPNPIPPRPKFVVSEEVKRNSKHSLVKIRYNKIVRVGSYQHLAHLKRSSLKRRHAYSDYNDE